MFDMLVFFAMVAFVGLFLGFTVRKLADWLDYSMDYGNIFHCVRREFIREFANEWMAQFDKEYEAASRTYHPERVDSVEMVMQKYANRYSRFILCKICFGTWLLVIIGLVCFYLMFGLWAYYPIFALASLSTFMD